MHLEFESPHQLKRCGCREGKEYSSGDALYGTSRCAPFGVSNKLVFFSECEERSWKTSLAWHTLDTK